MEHYAPCRRRRPSCCCRRRSTAPTRSRCSTERLALEIGRARTEDRVLLDSFDGRLRAAGLRAERPPGRRGGVLTVHEPGAPPRRVEVEPARRHLASELPEGPVRRRLADVLEMRALVPVVRLRSSVLPLAVVNGDEKTVVRLVIERAEAVADSKRVPLAPRLAVEPVLGYDEEHARTLRVLRDRLGLEPAARPVYDEAVVAVGGRLGGVPSKPNVAFAPGTRSDVAADDVLTQLAAIAEANVPGTLADLDTEFLHDLRVAVRRARAVLRELEAVHEAGAARARARRAQVDPDAHRPGPRPRRPAARLGRARRSALTRAGRRAPAAARAAEAAARARVHAAPARAAQRPLRGGAGGLARAGDARARGRARCRVAIELVAADRIRRVYRRMVRDGSAIDDDSPAEALHDLRKRGKELRYLLELFGGLFEPKVVKPMVKALKDLQDVLGRFQDGAVESDMLRDLRDELAGEPGGPAALIALGPALEALVAGQQDARDDFADRFAAFAAPKQRALVRDTFPKRDR